jgi:ketosteroid isomerase-like protein
LPWIGFTELSAGAAPTIVAVTNAEAESILRAAYRAFNARDIESALELMHPEVDWPNAWEGGRVVGREAVADYWHRQFKSISSTVEPERFDREPDGSVTAAVHQVVNDARSGALIADERVSHRYWIEEGLIVRMDTAPTP